MASPFDRRQLFDYALRGVGATALLQLLLREGLAHAGATASRDQRLDGFPNHPPRVKRAIQICLIGGLSHLDSFDYKPELALFFWKFPRRVVSKRAIAGRLRKMRGLG